MNDIQQSTVGAWLNRVAREYPDHEALVHHHLCGDRDPTPRF